MNDAMFTAMCKYRDGREAIITRAGEYGRAGEYENWQNVSTPFDIVGEMCDLIDVENALYIVLFSMEFLEVLINNKQVMPENILFFADTKFESNIANRMYGVETGILAKHEVGADMEKFQEIVKETIDNAVNFDYIYNINQSDGENMKAQVVIGNPPYNANSNSRDSVSLYDKFVESAIDLNPDYVSMIVPSRWMQGGKGLNCFRKRMMNDNRLQKIVHFAGDKEIFPTVSIKGGVNYFLWSKDHNEECEFVNGNSTTKRFLNTHDIIIQDNNAFSIIEKVLNNSSKWVSETCLSRKPFGLATNFNDFKDTGVKCICQGKKENFVDPNAFTDKNDVLGKWKVCTSKGGAVTANKDGQTKWLGTYFVLEPNAICTETYIVVNVFDSKTEAENFISYMKTKFFRFILGTRVSGLDINKEKFAWVPDLEDYSAPWTDKELYKKYNLTRQQVAYIESKIKAI